MEMINTDVLLEASSIENDQSVSVSTSFNYVDNIQIIVNTMLPLMLGGIVIYSWLCPMATKIIEDNLELKPNSVLTSIHCIMNRSACNLAQSKLKISSELCAIKVTPYVTKAVEGIQKHLQGKFRDSHQEVNSAIFLIGFGLFGAGVLAKTITDKAVKIVFSFFRQDQCTASKKDIEPCLPAIQRAI